MEGAPSVDALDRNDVESVQAFLHFWDQHISTWHPDKDCPPAAIHPSARLFNTLNDTKQELAEILNRLQHHTHCAPGYCERKKKSTGEILCHFEYSKALRENSELAKDPGRDFAELNTRRNDELLNSYNPTFILGWRANIDFRPVINKNTVIAYVGKYVSEGETSSSSYKNTWGSGPLLHMACTSPMRVHWFLCKMTQKKLVFPQGCQLWGIADIPNITLV